jgi:hypothetical protein
MKKYFYLIGFYGSVVLLIALNNNFWFTIGKIGHWMDNGVSILFIYLLISVWITRTQYKDAYFERKNAFKTALWFGLPATLLLVMSFISGFDSLSFSFYFTLGLFILAINYLIAGLLK